jgi:hypothetical protein
MIFEGLRGWLGGGRKGKCNVESMGGGSLDVDEGLKVEVFRGWDIAFPGAWRPMSGI